MVMENQLDRLKYYTDEYDYYANKLFQLINKPITKLKQKMEKTVEKEQVKTYGQKAVGISFNPSNDSAVDRIKQICANAIDEMDSLRKETTSSEIKRMCSVAITDLQSGQMWAVKAITWKD